MAFYELQCNSGSGRSTTLDVLDLSRLRQVSLSSAIRDCVKMNSGGCGVRKGGRLCILNFCSREDIFLGEQVRLFQLLLMPKSISIA